MQVNPPFLLLAQCNFLFKACRVDKNQFERFLVTGLFLYRQSAVRGVLDACQVKILVLTQINFADLAGSQLDNI